MLMTLILFGMGVLADIQRGKYVLYVILYVLIVTCLITVILVASCDRTLTC